MIPHEISGWVTDDVNKAIFCVILFLIGIVMGLIITFFAMRRYNEYQQIIQDTN